MVQVTVNGEARAAPDGATVASLLQDLGVTAAAVGVERNREIVPKSEYDATRLQDGDVLEVVQFVGGG